MFPFPDSERLALLRLARRSVISAVETGRPAETGGLTGALMRPAGAFVSLHRGQRLRGCIGLLEAERAVAIVVTQCAASAALHDPRFLPVTAGEVSSLTIEISVLSPAERILPERIETGRHGLIVTYGAQRGVLLPQVATQFGFDSLRFLEETCRKAGLPADAWRDPMTQVDAFTAEVFSETDFAAEKAAASPADSYSSST
jgi:AmmeMemoRadiSam system protein A